jgi:molybdopterin-guanine dinucleotide biosynthesis protein A
MVSGKLHHTFVPTGRFAAQTTKARYDLGMSDLTAFVLAGGKSTRMGKDKAFLCVGSETLLNRALQLAGKVTANVCIVGDRDKFSGFDCAVVDDIYRDRGPLGGIYAALSSTSTDVNLVLAVDMPLLNDDFLRLLVNQSRESGATVTVPKAGGGFQPLCAVYRKEFADLAGESLRAGRNKIDPLFNQVSTRIIVEDELTQAGFSGEMFRNVNTPEDLDAAKRLASGRDG